MRYRLNMVVLSSTTHPESQHLTTATQIWVGKMPHIHLAHMQPSLGPVAFHPGTTIQDDQIQEPGALIYDTCPRTGSRSTTTNHTETKPLSHRSGSWKGPTHYCRVLQAPGTGRQGPWLVSTSRNRSSRQA